MHFLKKGICMIIAMALLGGCAKPTKEAENLTEDKNMVEKQEALTYEADPNDFSLNIKWKDRLIPVSLPSGEHQAENIKEEDGVMKWEYPGEGVAVTLTLHTDYLDVEIESTTEEDHTFHWPYVSGETYYMPFGEGKRIPGNDAVWSSHLKGQIYSAVEQLSMPFFSSAGDDYTVTYIMENPVRSSLVFSEGEKIDFSVSQEYQSIDEKKVNRLRIYVTDNDPVDAAKVYRQYKIEQNQFVTLKEKAEQNPNVEKLFGAPHIYLWGEFVISSDDINWPNFRNSLNSPVMEYVLSYQDGSENKEELGQVLSEISTQDYVSDYQKNMICRFLSEVLMKDGFYQADSLPAVGVKMNAYLKKGKENLNQAERIQLNKYALAENMPGVFHPVDTWMNTSTVDVLNGMKEAGIDQAWIGLNSWEQAYVKPELAGTAIDNDYLLASYDSYHSIHEPGKEQWITAAFDDTELYENASVQKKDGEMEEGFQGVGRKLNPTLSMPAVKARMEEISGTNISFQSWFIDCDATGEIYDDYAPDHVTSKHQDLDARLSRMGYIRDQYNLVIGSEGGNDFAAADIAFAHGIELQSFSWMDADMKGNKDSEFYMGKYFNSAGGVAERFAKRIPVKEEYRQLFLEVKYDLPLYGLVYNDSIITTYHWDWSTIKIKGEEQNRMLRELLYNVPPLYHLDQEIWETYQTSIADHVAVWSKFSKEAANEEMTDFAYLSENGDVQLCVYGEDLFAAANFGDSDFVYMDEIIPAHSALISMDGEMSVYTPKAID